jgi:quercetin dioxygenase-like cupin family protein
MVISLAEVVMGVTAYSATTSIVIEGMIPDSKVFDGPVRLTVRELTLKPGEEPPLHYHPGHVFIVQTPRTLAQFRKIR